MPNRPAVLRARPCFARRAFGALLGFLIPGVVSCGAAGAQAPPLPDTHAPADPLAPGDHTRTLTVEGRKRTNLVHVPEKREPQRPVPAVLALHGSASTPAARAMAA